MADRRTTVVIDVQIGDIIVPSGSIVVPAKVELDAKDESVKKSAQSLGNAITKVLTPLVGGTWARQIAGVLGVVEKNIVGAVSKIGPALAIVGLAVAAVVGYFKYLAWWSRTVLELFKQLVAVLKTVAKGLWEVNAAMVRFIAAPLRPMLAGSIQALQWFTGATVDAAKSLYDLTERVMKQAVEVGAEFEQQTANTATAMGTFGEEGMKMRQWLGDAAAAMTRFTATMPTEAMRAMWDVASAGYEKQADLLNITSSAVLLANATLEKLSDTTTTVISLLNAFNLGTDQSSRVVNALAAAAARTATDIPKLIQSMKYVAPVAYQFGWSIEQTLAALGALSQQGIKASQAGTGLRAMLFNLAAQTDKTHKAFVRFAGSEEALYKILGPEGVQAFNPTKHTLQEILTLFERLTRGRSQQEIAGLMAEAFNVRSGQTLMALLTTGTGRLKALQDDITGTNLAFQMQQDQLLTMQGAWKVVLNLWEVAQIQMSQGIGSTLREFVTTLQMVVDWGNQFGIFKMLGQTAGQYLMMLAKPLALLAGPALKSVAPLIEYLGRAFAAMGDEFAKAANLALPYVVEFFQKLLLQVPRVMDLFQRMGVWLISVGLPMFLRWAELVGPMLITVFDNVAQAVTNLLSQGGDRIGQWFNNLLRFAIDLTAWLPNMIPLILSAADALIIWAKTIFDMGRELIPQLLSALQALLPQISAFVMTYLPILRAELGYIIDVVKDFAQNALPRIVEAFKTVQPYIIQILGSIVEAVKAVTAAIGELATSIAEQMPGIAETLKTMFGFLKDNAREVIQAVITALSIQLQMKAMSVALKLAIIDPAMAWQVLKMGSAGASQAEAIGGRLTPQPTQEEQRAQANDRLSKRLGMGMPGGPQGSDYGFGGWRAAGGPVAAGNAYVVGENGMEWFVPKQSGYIIPNGGPGSFTVVCSDTDAMEQAMRAFIARRRAQETHARTTYAANLA